MLGGCCVGVYGLGDNFLALRPYQIMKSPRTMIKRGQSLSHAYQYQVSKREITPVMMMSKPPRRSQVRASPSFSYFSSFSRFSPFSPFSSFSPRPRA